MDIVIKNTTWFVKVVWCLSKSLEVEYLVYYPINPYLGFHIEENKKEVACSTCFAFVLFTRLYSRGGLLKTPGGKAPPPYSYFWCHFVAFDLPQLLVWSGAWWFLIGCMGIFVRDSTFIDSFKYFHKCLKKEKIEIILSFF